MRNKRSSLALAALAALAIGLSFTLFGPGPAGAEDEKPPLLLIFEPNLQRGRYHMTILEPHAKAAGVRLAVLDTELGREGAFKQWIRNKQREVEFDPARVVLLGFSASGPGAVRFALRYQHDLAGLVLAAASGIDLLPSDYEVLDKAFPILLVYSRKDTNTPIGQGRELRKTIRKAKLEVTWEELERENHFDVLKNAHTVFLPWLNENSWCLAQLRMARQCLKDRKPELAVACRDRVKAKYPKAEAWLDLFLDLLPREETDLLPREETGADESGGSPAE